MPSDLLRLVVLIRTIPLTRYFALQLAQLANFHEYNMAVKFFLFARCDLW